MNQEKKEKMKKAAGNAAKIVGAASVGAGSVVAAEAWQNMEAMPDEETDVVDGNAADGEAQEVDEPEVFNVEDIMIDVEHITATVGGGESEGHTSEEVNTDEPVVAVVEPQPITDGIESGVPQTDIAQVEPVNNEQIDDVAGYYPTGESGDVETLLYDTPAPEPDPLADTGDIIDPLSDMLA